MRNWFEGGVLLAVCLATFLGCANPQVTRESYERIHEGMAMEAVEEILGDPSYRHKDKLYYKGKYGTIRIEAKHGRVDDIDWKD